MLEKILYVDLPGYKELPKASTLKLSSQGLEPLCVADLESALHTLSRLQDVKILISNAPCKELFIAFKKQCPESPICLITDKPMERYAKELDYEEEHLLDHVIANRFPSPWTLMELQAFLRKIYTQEYFGISRYLAKHAKTVALSITDAKDRQTYNKQVSDFALEANLGANFAKLIYGVSEELLMNALRDAPLAAQNNNSPKQRVPQGQTLLEFGCDDDTFALAVQDPFGALTKEKLFQYLKKVLIRGDEQKLIDTKKEGAGLGLYKIFYSSHALICNVVPDQKTEVISLIDLKFKVKDFSKLAKSIYFFKALK